MIKSLLKVLAVFLFMATVVSVPLTAHTETEIGTASLDYLSALVSSLSKIVSSLASSVASLVNPSSQLAQVAPTDGLVAHWTFDKGSGTIAEDSAGSNTGILTNGPVWVEGKVGSGALEFDGVDDVIYVVDSPSFDNTNTITISAWVKPSMADAGNIAIASKTRELVNFPGWALYRTSGELYRLTIYDGTTQKSANSTAFADTKVHHVVGVYNGANMQMYIDGVASGASTAATLTIPDTTRGLCLGASQGNTTTCVPSYNFWPGTIDDVRIYSRALTPAEISDLYALGGGSPPSGGTNQAPNVSAGSSQTITLQATATLAGAASDDGLPAGSSLTNTWSRVSGPGAVTFSNPNSLSVAATFSSAGAYVLQLSSSDTALTSTANITITVNAAPPQGDTTPPTLSNGSPSGQLSSGTTQTTIFVATNESATCKYGASPGASYSSQPSIFSSTGGTAHSTTLDSLQNGQAYAYFVRCQDTAGNPTTSDYPISFSVRNPSTLPPMAKVIGSETLIPLPTSALWSGYVNFRPGDGEVVDLNPPRFSWSYNPDPTAAYCPGGTFCGNYAPHEFIFQIADNQNFASPIVNIRTPYNTYNFLSPLTSGRTYYWRIAYIRPKNLSNPATWTTQPDSWESAPYVWSGTRSFTISGTATDWDRSKLADETYLAEKGQHPHMYFNSSNRAQVAQFLEELSAKYKNGTAKVWEKDAGAGWTAIKQGADQYIGQSAWWTRTNADGIYSGNWASAVTTVAVVWQMTRDPKYLAVNPQQALVNMAQWYVSVGGDRADIVSGVVDKTFIRALALGYDWLYEVMSSEQRAVVLNAIERNALYLVKGGGIWFFPYDSRFRWGSGDPSALYEGGFWVNDGSHAKIGSSHPMATFQASLIGAMSAYADSPAVREFFNMGVNYFIGVTWPYGSDGGMSRGRGYGVGDYTMAIPNALLFQMLFPEAQFNLNPFFKLNTDWWELMVPVGFIQGNEPFGDTGGGPVYGWQDNTFGRNLALLLNDGSALKHWREEIPLYPAARHLDTFDKIMPLFYFSTPAEASDKSLGRVFPREGWALGCSAQPNDPSCIRDGVGFTMQARPRGGDSSHENYNDLSFQLWAYGTAITDGGSGYGDYSRIPMSNNPPFVNGLGPLNPIYPKTPYFSRIVAFKDTADYTYTAADGVNSYPHYNYSPSGYEFPCSSNITPNICSVMLNGTPPPYATPLSFLKKVNRHILFVHKKYFVVYDDFEAEQPATFSWLYHIPYIFNITGKDANGRDVYTTQDTLQLDTTKMEYKYKVGNKYPDRLNRIIPTTNVSVQVAHITTHPEEYILKDQTGSVVGNNVRSNPFTGEDYYNWSGGGFPRAHALWVSNKTPTNNFHFMTVIYPKNPADETAGKPDPVIERIDDYTARVTSPDGTVDVISFNPDTAAANGATLVVDLPNMIPLPVPDGGYGAVVTPPPPPPPSPYTLSLSTSGAGQGTVTGTGISCGADCSQSLSSGTSVTLYAAAPSGSTFTGWTGCASTAGVLPNQTCTVSMTQNRSVAAAFTLAPDTTLPTTYILAVSSQNGGISCNGSACLSVYNTGTTLSLLATPSTGYTFVNWGGA